MKKTLSIILAILMIVSTVPMAFAAGGNFGTNNALSWSYSSGTLTISGQGAMPEYGSSYDTPWWNSYRNDIKNIVVNEGVTNVGANALSYFPNLTSVSLSSTVTSLSSGALAGNTALTEITIPKNVSSVHEKAFFGCSALTQFKVDSANQSFKVIDGVLFSKDGTKLCLYPVNKSLESYTVPSGTKTIERSAFQQNKYLKTLVISEGVEGIKYTAFAQASALTTVKFSSTVTIIDSFAFADCLNLTSVTFEEGLEKIYTGAFDNDTKLANVVLPSSVKTISEYAFEDCQTVHYLGAETDLTSFKSTGNGAIHFTEYSSTVPATCTKEGTKELYFCPDCVAVVYGGEAIAIDPDAHNFSTTGESIRPVYNESTNTWSDGYYKCVCTNGCGALDKVYAEELKRADYTEYDKVVAEFEYILDNYNLSSSGRANILAELSKYSVDENKFANEQGVVNSATSTLTNRLNSINRYLDDYVKSDYTQADSLIAELDTLVAGNDYEPLKNDVAELKSRLNDLKSADESASDQEFELEDLVDDIADKIDGLKKCAEGDHSINGYIKNNDATCDEYGTMTAYCKRNCGYSRTDVDYSSGKGHDYVYTIVQEPTCINKGIRDVSCTRCDYFEDNVIYSPALGHTKGDYVPNGDATCTADGTKTASCIYCGRAQETVPDVGSKKDHTFRMTADIVKKATCTENEVRVYKCRYCTATEEREVEKTTVDHDFSVYVGVHSEATCQDLEVGLYECSYGCKTTETKIHYATLKNHVGGTATCIKAAVCDNCGEEYGGTQYNNHMGTKTLVDSKPGNCTNKAYEEYLCGDCGETWREYGDIDVNNHNMSVFDCNEESHYYMCSGCLHVEERIPHTPGEWIYFPFIDHDGVEKYRKQSICTVCDYPIDETITYEEYLEATQGETNNCDHLCHKDGFMGFIWKIVKFFSKLFKLNPVCECGAAHY